MDRQAKVNALLYPKGKSSYLPKKPSSNTPQLLGALQNAIDHPRLFKEECIDSECPGDKGWPCNQFDKNDQELLKFIKKNNEDKLNPIKIDVNSRYGTSKITHITTELNYNDDTITYVLF